MSASVTAAQPPTTEQGPRATCSEQFRTWVSGLEGQKLWSAMSSITIDGICHALDQVSAATYGLLISQQGTAILSAINPVTLARLETRYREAAEAGLCFWCEDGTLARIEDSEAFLARIGTLPPPPTPLYRRYGLAYSFAQGERARQERRSPLRWRSHR